VSATKEEKRRIEEALELQRKQSEEDSKWLQREEQNFVSLSSFFF
jgi:hypothetical protein